MADAFTAGSATPELVLRPGKPPITLRQQLPALIALLIALAAGAIAISLRSRTWWPGLALAGGLGALLVAVWLWNNRARREARIEVYPDRLLIWTIGRPKSVARGPIARIVRRTVVSNYGVRVPAALLVDASGRLVARVSPLYDMDRLGAALRVPVDGDYATLLDYFQLAKAFPGSGMSRGRMWALAAVFTVLATIGAVAYGFLSTR
jgi:hypothetical protein